MSKVKFETVSMDFIFFFFTQTFQDLKSDLDTAFEIWANHVAIYPFIDFTFTTSKVKCLSKKQKRKLLDDITNYLLDKWYKRDSIRTFSNDNHAKYSSMTRDNFLWFGCSATTLFKNQFKINTFSIKEYCKRINDDKLATSLTIRFTLRQRMIYYLFWTAYSMKVDSKNFEDFFGISLEKMYGLEFKLAKLLGFIKEKNGVYEMTLKYEPFHLFVFHLLKLQCLR